MKKNKIDEIYDKLDRVERLIYHLTKILVDHINTVENAFRQTSQTQQQTQQTSYQPPPNQPPPNQPPPNQPPPNQPGPTTKSRL